jgi:predicted lipoprotein with Yx(FWY)xxD motif
VLVAPGTKVTGGAGIHGHFATFKRSDGTTQMSYNGQPLYTWPGDLYAGDTTGQGLGGFSVAKP